jgi:L-alanine-DL-glutamate epimerase-like enolase superfamily enzyme
MADPTITKIENIYFAHQIHDMSTDYNGFNQVYEKGAVLESKPCVVRIHTSEGITGEYLGRPVPDNVARYLLGKNPFARERIYNDLKRGLRHTDGTAISSVDVALWDFAGKAYNAPIWQLLGGWSCLPFASTRTSIWPAAPTMAKCCAPNAAHTW